MTKYILHIEPKAQSRPRFTRQGRVYEQKDMTNWKKSVARTLRLRHPKTIEKGAISISLTFYIYPPQSISKIKTKRPRTNHEIEKVFVDKRPDLDNYIKALLDASNGILFKDDGQVAAMSAQKLYSLDPRIEIEIYELEDE
ncbi:RusA family crossover junction endodeoxyribonuclease (plasmid) [Vagococcus lutrae]|uniref:RusA family crossover junction endodeoxyribonuclease n=1 Tax=Vagococcus lutrae TaxID=81947 RepID=A0AAE9XG80_9ENTE|nr:RusA family crossover junction endodeoxyribonuclease [Vagococcus lutrae]MDO5742340.1 RusA family crossover junction endodeoxyribonuclease [Vagococcus sp.]WCG23694.1 RusA family crossover junction endodeoxyribonuclease [Vagococcus lutrae]